MRQTKTSKVTELIRLGKYPEALAIIAHFKRDFTKEQMRTIQIAHECFQGNTLFYQGLGIDIDLIKLDAVLIITNKYLQ